jgi:hypothetical protein
MHGCVELPLSGEVLPTSTVVTWHRHVTITCHSSLINSPGPRFSRPRWSTVSFVVIFPSEQQGVEVLQSGSWVLSHLAKTSRGDQHDSWFSIEQSITDQILIDDVLVLSTRVWGAATSSPTPIPAPLTDSDESESRCFYIYTGNICKDRLASAFLAHTCRFWPSCDGE